MTYNYLAIIAAISAAADGGHLMTLCQGKKQNGPDRLHAFIDLRCQFTLH